MKRVTTLLLNGLAALRDGLFMSGGFGVSPKDLQTESISENRMVTVVADRRRLLKIKLKSLAAEARIIRQEELKAKHSKRPEVQDLRMQMHEHRVKDLREESRATLLAYSFIRGKPYRDIEGRSDWGVETATIKNQWASRMDRIRAMVSKYGTRSAQDVDLWLRSEPNRALPPRKPKVPYRGPKGPLKVDIEIEGNTAT